MKFYIKINTENCLIDELKRKLRTPYPFSVLIVIFQLLKLKPPVQTGGFIIYNYSHSIVLGGFDVMS